MSCCGLVLFDLGDVIASWDPAPRLSAYARRSGRSIDEVVRRLSAGGFWEDTDRGGYSAAQMHEQICERLGVAFSRDEILELQAMAFTVRPEVVRIAEEISATHRVGILTNNAPLLRDAFPLHFPELVRVFSPILYSFQFGHTKPERALFEAVAMELALAPADIFFIDDQLRHVSGARSAGWQAVQFESVQQIRRVLAERIELAGRTVGVRSR
jgi:HAD superfamily hydrolase (TIGR01509 family)